MRNISWIVGLLLALVTTGQGVAGEPVRGCGPACGYDGTQQSFVQRIHPAGGWNPYGGGLLHWWDPSCYPHCGGPDDYCRKPLPRLCWPGPYPSSYTWGPAETCCPRTKPSAGCCPV